MPGVGPGGGAQRQEPEVRARVGLPAERRRALRARDDVTGRVEPAIPHHGAVRRRGLQPIDALAVDEAAPPGLRPLPPPEARRLDRPVRAVGRLADLQRKAHRHPVGPAAGRHGAGEHREPLGRRHPRSARRGVGPQRRRPLTSLCGLGGGGDGREQRCGEQDETHDAHARINSGGRGKLWHRLRRCHWEFGRRRTPMARLAT